MLGSTIQRELAVMIQRDLQDPRLTGMPSITRVRVSPDLAVADVYVTVMGTPGQQTAALHALQHSAGMMRAKLTKALTLRQSPFLKFHIDENLKKEIEVLELLRKVSLENEELDRRRAAAADAARDELAGNQHHQPPEQTATPVESPAELADESNDQNRVRTE